MDGDDAHDRNATAVKILRELQEQNRVPTDDERAALLAFEGWGSYNERQKSFDWRGHPSADLRESLTVDESKSIVAASPDAPIGADARTYAALWRVAAHAAGNHTGLRVGVPCAGHGAVAEEFDPVAWTAQLVLFSPCPVASAIAGYLAPAAKVVAKRPHESGLPAGFFDLVAGAAPLGDSSSESNLREDPLVPRSVSRIGAEYWFVAHSIMSARRGGLAVVLVPRRFAEYGIDAKTWIARRAEYIGGVRSRVGASLCDVLVFRRRLVDDQEAKAWDLEDLYHASPEELEDKLLRYVPSNLLLARQDAPKKRPKPPAYKPKSPEEALAVDLYRKARRAFDALLEPGSDAEALLAPLADRHTALVKVTGPLHSAEHDKKHKLRGMIETREWRLLSMLEVDGRVGPLLTERCVRPWEGHETKTADAALRWSIDRLGRVDVGEMARVLGINEFQVEEQLSDRIFLDPATDRWLVAEEYLSGHVSERLKEARTMALLDGRFQRNVDALEKVQPPPLAEDITVPLGAPWLPADVVRDFAMHISGAYSTWDIEVTKIRCGGGWVVKNNNKRLDSSVQNVRTWGVEGMTGLEILECVLDLRTPEIWIKIEDDDGKDKKIRDPGLTAAAQGKADEIREEWDRWIRVEEERFARLRKTYADKYTGFVRRKFSGVELSFPGLALAVDGRPFDPRAHQREAVEQINEGGQYDDSSLVVHHVGYGKTASLLAAAVREWLVGRIDRVFIVVPRNVVNQWRGFAAKLYPTLADEFMVAPEEFRGLDRDTFLARVIAGEAAFIILTYEQYQSVPPSEKALHDRFSQENSDIQAVIEDLTTSKDEVERRALEKILKSMKRSQDKQLSRNRDRWAKLRDGVMKYGGRLFSWEDVVGEPAKCHLLSGDEWQYLKKLPIHTRMSRVAGLPSDDSMRAMDAETKVRYVGDAGGRVGGLTGTPLTNSLAECHVSMRFFQPRLLRKLGLEHFDDFAATFCKPIVAVEMDAVGNFRPVTRLQFVNVPELLDILAQCWAFASRSDEVERPDLVGGEPIIVEVEGSDALHEYVEKLAERAEMIHAGEVDPSEDNMLKVTSDGRKAAMWNGEPGETFPKPLSEAKAAHAALVKETEEGIKGIDLKILAALPDFRETKLDACAENVWNVYAQHHDDRGVQLVFCDLGTPKGEADADATPEEKFATEALYGELRTRLVAKGILQAQIAFIHDAKTQEARDSLLADVNAGRIRVLLGSTDKLGVGTNPQRRVVAIHDLDCPWRPDQLIQRTGRGRRDGNLWKSLYHFIYVTTRSYDVCLWQIIQAKATFITRLQEGIAVARTVDDVGDLVLTSAMAKALALGDARVVDKIKLETNLTHLERQKRSWDAVKESAKKELERLPDKLMKLEHDLANTEQAKDLKDRAEVFMVHLRDLRSSEYDLVHDVVEADSRVYVLSNALRPVLRKPMRVGTYRGRPLSLVLKFGAPYLTMDIGGGSTVEVPNIHSAGSFTALDRELGMIEVRLNALKKTVEAEKKKHAALQAEVDRPWPQMEKAIKQYIEYESLCDELARGGLVDRRRFTFIDEAAMKEYVHREVAEIKKQLDAQQKQYQEAVQDFARRREEFIKTNDNLLAEVASLHQQCDANAATIRELRTSRDEAQATAAAATRLCKEARDELHALKNPMPRGEGRFGFLEVDCEKCGGPCRDAAHRPPAPAGNVSKTD